MLVFKAPWPSAMAQTPPTPDVALTLGHLDFDDLVYGSDPLSTLVARNPGTKDGLTRFLYEAD